MKTNRRMVLTILSGFLISNLSLASVLSAEEETKHDVESKPQPRLILGGACVVTLVDEATVAPGVAALNGVYRGVRYRFASREKMERFLKSPQNYVPLLDGCDPTIFADTGRCVPGKLENGALIPYFGRCVICLFASRENLSGFLENDFHLEMAKDVTPWMLPKPMLPPPLPRHSPL